MNIKAELKSAGWYLTDEGIEICSEESVQQTSTKSVIKCALDMDLAEIGEKTIPDDLNKGKDKKLNCPCVLQVVKVRNVSAPKANEDSSVAPRMLQIHLSDGHRTCTGVEHNNNGKLSLNIAPGSKVCLKDTVKIQNGFLLLTSENLDLIGGKVESIYNKWIATKEASGFSRANTDVDETPPPFVQFGKKITYKCKTNVPSLQKSSGNQEVEDDDREFMEQRHAAIAEVSKTDVGGKIFSGGNKSAEVSNSGFRYENKKITMDNHKDGPTHKSNFTKLPYKTVKVEEDICSQIIQMGFSRADASAALQQFNNNLDAAVDHLLSSGEQAPESSRYRNEGGSNRGGRNDRRGRDGNDGRGGRGRGRSRTNRQDGDTSSDQRPSTNATLFDFLETKITSTSSNPGTSKQTQDHGQNSYPVGETEDDRLQEESIIEYVKELSLVETHGGSVDRDRDSDNKPDKEHAGIIKYRGKSKGDDKRLPKEHRENDEKWQGSNDYDAEEPNRNRRTPRNPRRERGEYNQDHHSGTGYDQRNGDNYRGGRGSRRRGGRGGRRGMGRGYSSRVQEKEDNDRQDNYREDAYDDARDYEKQNFENSRSSGRDNRYNRGGFDGSRGGRDNRGRRGNREGYDSRRGRDERRIQNNRRDAGDICLDDDQEQPENSTRPPRKSEYQKSSRDRYNELPPRLQRKKMQEMQGNVAFKPERAFYQPPTARQPDYNSNVIADKKNMTLGETARQLKSGGYNHHQSSNNPDVEVSQQRAVSVFPEQKMVYRQKPASSHSYQDQRQQTRNMDATNGGDRSCEFRPRDHEPINWFVGMICRAKYWEDNRFYSAVVKDIHPTQPTAVVEFMEYGNCEEVLFGDMRPDREDDQSYDGPTSGLEFTRGHRGPTRYSNLERSGRGPLRPTRTLYQPPTQSK